MNTVKSQHDERLDVLLAEYLARIDRGEVVNLTEFCSANPDLEAELREFLEMANLLEFLGNGPATVDEKLAFKSTADALSGQPTLADVGYRARSCDPLVAATKQATQGVQFGRYFLQEILGEGSMGAVQLAYDTVLDRFVAIKTPRFQGEQSAAAIERFRREARASAMVRHPNICPIFDVGIIDGVHFLSMAYIDGESLAQPLERGEVFSIPRILQLIRQLAEALQEAHRHDVIHRDLKPANIMLDDRGEPIITDFGLARRLDMHETLLTQSGMLVGTLAFMSPEQLEGKPELIGQATDVYSLGVIFYQLLCGRLPYSGGFLSVILQIRAGQPESPVQHRPELQNCPGIEAVCLRMMAADPKNRYGSMAEVVTAIAELQGETLPPPVEPPCAEPPIPREVDSTTTTKSGVFPIKFQQSWGVGALGTLAMVLLLSILSISGWSAPGFRKRGEIARDTKNSPASPPAGAAAPAITANKPTLPEPGPAVAERVPKQRLPAKPAPVLPPVVANAPAGMQIKSRRSASEKFGVVEVDLAFPADGDLEYRPDWACRVSSADGRVFYPTYQFELAEDAAAAKSPLQVPRGKVSRITASFLSYGEQPLHIELRYGNRVLLAKHDIPVDVAAADQPALLNDWWASYSQPPREPLNDEARQIKTYLHSMLARRMRLTPAPALPLSNDDASMLQRYFEKSVGTFLGFASVRTALGEQDTFAHATVEPLNRTVPQPPRIAPVQFPEPSGAVSIESIASHVPDDCVYLRCHSLENYLWFRDLMLGWGGGLNEIVSPRRIDRPVRERLERQLALSTDANAQAKLKMCLTDLAVIFGDTCFEDGAAVGVLFQAKDDAQLRDLLKQQRQQGMKAFQAAGAKEMLVTIGKGQDSASLLSTADNRLRSYHATSGKFHFVTNSEYLVERFFDCSRGQRNLLNLKEFRYARTKVRLNAEQDVFLYMPDPFFQRIIGPQYQIEMGRRRQANADLLHLELARLAAKGEGFSATNVSHLIETGFLPTNFSNRSDGSQAQLRPNGAVDSLRGVSGTFIPICDLDIDRATSSEVSEYERFSQRYRREYRMMDPVAVVVSHQKQTSGIEDVKIEIAITPFARGTYEKVQNILDTPQQSRIVTPPGELLSLRGSLRSHQGTSFLALASIHDTNLKFHLADGKVQVDGYQPGETFAGNNWLLAIDRREPECLETLFTFAGELGISTSTLQSLSMVKVMVAGYVDMLRRLANLPPLPAVQVAQPSGAGWQLRSPRDDLKNTAAFEKVPTADAKHIRFEMKALQGAQIEPYIQAYTYLEARRASAKQAALLELTMQQFCLKPADVLPALERINSARILCPLNGRLEFTSEQAALGQLHGNQWCSDKWTTSSLYDEDSVPEEYRFPFTDWLRGLNVGFSLNEQTLNADLELQVLPRGVVKQPAAASNKPALQK